MSLDASILSGTVGLTLVASVGATILLLLLIVSFGSRPRVFCQYLRYMTGIELQPATVRARYRQRGRAGVRDLLIDLLIQQDLADPARIVTPDSAPDHSVFEDPA